METVYEMLNSLRPEFDFKSSKDFIEDGYLDSFDVVSLVTELEDHFDCIIDALDILPENFNTVASIMNIVKKNGGKCEE